MANERCASLFPAGERANIKPDETVRRDGADETEKEHSTRLTRKHTPPLKPRSRTGAALCFGPLPNAGAYTEDKELIEQRARPAL